MLEYTEQPSTPKVGEIEFKGVHYFFVLTVKLPLGLLDLCAS
jgi:hypothetical protein